MWQNVKYVYVHILESKSKSLGGSNKEQFWVKN